MFLRYGHAEQIALSQIALSNGRFVPISCYQPVGFPPAFRNEMASAPPARSSRHRGSAPAAPLERIVATTAAHSRAAFRFPACSGPLMGTKARIARPLERQAEVIGTQDVAPEARVLVSVDEVESGGLEHGLHAARSEAPEPVDVGALALELGRFPGAVDTRRKSL